MVYVIDTSVLMKRVLDDDGHEEMRAWMQEALDEGVTIRAPSLVSFEVGNVVAKQFEDEGAPELAKLHREVLEGVDTVEPAPEEVMVEAKKGLAYYDAAYLALAGEGDIIVTGDHRIQKAAGAEGIDVLEF